MLVDRQGGTRIDKGPTDIVSESLAGRARRRQRPVVHVVPRGHHRQGRPDPRACREEPIRPSRRDGTPSDSSESLSSGSPRKGSGTRTELDSRAAVGQDRAPSVGFYRADRRPGLLSLLEAELDLNCGGRRSLAFPRRKFVGKRFAKSVTLSRLLGFARCSKGNRSRRTVLTESFPALVSDLDLGRAFPSTRKNRCMPLAKPAVVVIAGLAGRRVAMGRGDSWASRRPTGGGSVDVARPRTRRPWSGLAISLWSASPTGGASSGRSSRSTLSRSIRSSRRLSLRKASPAS